MASKEELRKLMLAMNPDAEQIEEAVAAAPKVPKVAKSLGKGFYEANVEPLLSPRETAMAIFGAGQEFVRDPKEFSKSVARAEMERLKAAGETPEAGAEYYGGMLSPFSLFRRLPKTEVVKPKGGDFPQKLSPIESLTPKLPEDIVGQLEPVRRENLTKILPAVNNWVNTKLDRYIRTEMATPEDPIRKLAEQDILHVAPGNLVQRPVDIRVKRERLAKSDLAGQWEDASDQALQIHRAKEFVNSPQGGAPLQQLDLRGGILNDILEEDPWIATVAQKDPNRPIYFPRRSLGDDLGFRHLKDELYNALRSDSDLPQQLRMTPEQLGRMSVPDAVRHVSKINRWREKQKAEANLALATNAATVPFKDYPDQKFGWFQLKADTPQGRQALQDALQYEGDMMGHCVGGYCDEVLSGRSEIYSLRNKKTGEPHVTIEVTQPIQPSDFYYQTADQGLIPRFPGVPPSFISRLDEAEKSGKPFNWEQVVRESPEYKALPKTILQIKGKGDRKPNATYIPFVQDFVKSQNWMDVKELRNTDLVDLRDTASTQNWINTKMATHVTPEVLKSLQDEGVRFATIEELNARHSALVKQRVAARKAAETPEAKTSRQQLRELRRAERRQQRGEE